MEYTLEDSDSTFPEAARITGDGFTVRVMVDDCPESPRELGDCYVGTMLCAHPSYQLGDVQAPQPFDTSVTCPQCEGSGLKHAGWATDDDDEDCPQCEGTGEVHLPVYEYLQREYGATVVLPLFLLDHSGLAMRAGQNLGSMVSAGRFIGDEAGWDTSHVGFIFDTKENRERTGVDPERIEEILRAEVEEYDDYLRGDVFYVVTEADDGTLIHSCGGYYGARAAEEAAQEGASYGEDHVRDERAKQARECSAVRYWAGRDVRTV